MSLTITIAPGTVDSRQRYVQAIADQLQAGETRHIFYLVPNHVKFDAEVDVLSRLGRAQGKAAGSSYAQSQVQVFSLTRLAWHFLQEQGQVQPPVLGPAGLFVLVSKIVAEQKDSLPTFARMAAKAGFIEKLVAQLAELRASQITPLDLLAIVQQLDGQVDQRQALTAKNLEEKLRDLSVVAAAFNEALADRFILAQDTLPYFVDQSNQLDLSQAVFYLEGFTAFTAAEWSVIQLLIQKADVNVVLLGQAQPADPLGNQPTGSVFAKPLETARRMRLLAKEAGVDCQVQAVPAAVPKQTRDYLLTAWAALGSYQPYQGAAEKVGLSAFAAANTLTELEEVARRIRRDLQEDDTLRFRDILVLARDLGPYRQHLPAVMQQFDLPYFLDDDIKMGNHPLVELVVTLLGPGQASYRQASILTILKSGYLRPSQNETVTSDAAYFDAVAYLENYLASHRVAKQTWQDDQAAFAYFTLPADDESDQTAADRQVNSALTALKRFVHQAFSAFDQGLQQAETLADGVRFLMQFLQDFQVTDQILASRDQLLAQGQLMKAQQLLEVWQLFVNILDQVVQVAGNESFQRDLLLKALQAGFAGGTFSGIPNQLDQLTISEAGIVQSQNYRRLYFIGGSRVALPAQIQNKALLSDQDRLLVQAQLADQPQPRYLRQTAQEQMAEESLVFYNALQAASEHVTLSYAFLDGEGLANERSPYYNRLLTAFGIDPAQMRVVNGQAASMADLVQEYTGTLSATIAQLVKLPEAADRAAELSAFLQAVPEKADRNRVTAALASHHYQNQPARIDPVYIDQLFPKPLLVSISQVESFYRNPYEYFLRYGLRLQENPSTVIDARIEGTVYHEVFDRVVTAVVQKHDRLAVLTDAAIQSAVTAALDKLMTEPAYAALSEAGRGQALAQYMSQQAVRVLQALRQASQPNASRPLATEMSFGLRPDELPTLHYQAGQQDLGLRGKLDRFDQQDPAGHYGTIIDYKLSGKSFRYADAANGFELQLLTYWQAANQNLQQLGLNQQAQVGGAFFAPIESKPTRFTDYKGDEQAVEKLLAGEVAPQNGKLTGLFLDDEDYYQALEPVEPGAQASAYQLSLKQNGQLTANSNGISKADLDLLIQQNQALMLAAANKIAQGAFDLTPKEDSLTYSPYTDVMRFDHALGDRYLQPKYHGRASAILEQLRQEQEGTDHAN